MPQMIYIPDSYTLTEALCSLAGLDKNYFRFRGCELNLLYNSIRLSNNNSVELDYDRIYNIFFECHPNNPIIEVYVDKRSVSIISKNWFNNNIYKIFIAFFCNIS